MTPSELIKTVTCARQRLDQGDACVCVCFGQGAGLGWLISVRCGGDDEITWVQPAQQPGEGVGYVRDFDCDRLRADFPSLLEQLDNLRADEVAAVNCYDWLVSFFEDKAGGPLVHGAANADWVKNYGRRVTVAPGDLQPGDIVIFKGRVKNPAPGHAHVGHVGIATGHGDEISQLWYTREIQDAMVKRKDFAPNHEEKQRPVRGGYYAVTRTSLEKLIQDFTDNDGTQYVFTPYEVWRISDPRWGNFDEFKGCE